MENINGEVLKHIEVNEDEPVEQKEPMEKPKKPRTAKQMEALKKAQEKLKEKRELKKKEKEEEKEIKQYNKSYGIKDDKAHLKNEDSDDDVIEYVKAPKKKKKTKPRIIVEDDSSDSDQEIVISRRRKSKSIKQKQQLEGYANDVKLEQKKTEPINIPDIDEAPSMEKPKKQSKSVEPIVKEQKYTREQILRAYGL